MRPFLYFTVLLFSFISSPAFAQVGGSTCATAGAVSCGAVWTGGTSGVAPDGFVNCGTEGSGGQQWYFFTATGSGAVTLSLCNPATTYDSRVHIYSGACGSLACVAQDDDACITPGLASEVSWTATVGTTYYIRIGGFFSGSGPFWASLICNFGGCTYPQASNYDPTATFDNGSCVFSGVGDVDGCTDPGACNYCNLCTGDDGSCDYSCLGCTYPYATNYDPGASVDDGSCLFPGCTDPSAFNFNPIAGVDDGSCDFAGTCLGDFNQDGVVGVMDVMMFVATFGGTCN